MSYPNIEIPRPVSMTGWKELPIEECGEPLVHLNVLAPELIRVSSGYYQQGIPYSSPSQYAREGVAQRLVQAAETLQRFKPGAKLLVIDAYRPYEVQKALFEGYKQRLREYHPNWKEETIDRRAQVYVSRPSTDPNRPSPHITGGAIDLTIIENGLRLDMGTEWDFFGKRAATAFFEKAKNRPATTYRDNRRLLYYCMTRADFSSYPEEWWHFDYGNQFWSQVSGKRPAIYSVIQH